MPNVARVSVVIVTYNAGKYIESCLKNVMNSYSVDEVIIVDNASYDNTIEVVRKNFGSNNSRLRIIRLRRNLGFPFACNIGVLQARNQYVVLMNPDVFVDPNCIDELASFLDRNSDIVFVQPKILSPKGYIDGVGGLMDILGHGYHIGKYERDRGQYNESRDIMYACFACTMVRRDIYLKLGGMDPRYFLYNEDLDIGWRAWLAGYRVSYVPGAIAYHVGQHATKKLPYHTIYFSRRNRLYTIYTNYPIPINIITSFVLIGFYIILGIFSSIRDKVEARITLRVISRFFRNLKYLARRRLLIVRKRRFIYLIRSGLISLKFVGLRLYLAKSYGENSK